MRESIKQHSSQFSQVLKLYGSARFLGLPSLGPLLFVAAICNGIAVFCGVICGAERLSGGSYGGGAPLVKTMQYLFLQCNKAQATW